MSDTDDFLEHYGIPGMRWGVRKSTSSGSSGTAKKRRSSDQVKKDDRKAAMTKRRTLSDKELDSRISRLEKERKLKSLTEDDISPGKTAVKNLIKNAGTKTASAVAAGAMLYAVKAAVTKSFNIQDAVGYITPKPKR